MLDGLFVTPAVTAITEALRSAKVTGTLAVLGNAKLATALAAHHDVIPIGLSARAAKKLPRHLADLSTVAPASLSAIVGVDISTSPAWQSTLTLWSLSVRDGGALIFVDRGHPHDASRRALCAGLTEIEQRHAGRAIVTSGLVSHFT